MLVFEEIKNEANAERTVESLRDSGYSISTSIADLVDNSIEAGAKTINLIFSLDFEGKVVFSLADDGMGMNKEGLINAMKYGSDVRKKQKQGLSLGKFGMGLKTASTSQAKSLKLISRNKKNVDALGIYMNLDDFSGWKNTLFSPDADELAQLDEVTNGDTGTLVIWEDIDRVLLTTSGGSYSDRTGEFAQKNIKKQLQDLKEHLNLVFYRFLQSYGGKKKRINIILNDEELLGWDPFLPKYVTGANEEFSMEVEHSEGSGQITVKAYTMPHQNDIGDDMERKEARISQEYQGFFVFREDRLLMLPDYFGIRKRDEHYKLFRGEINFYQDLDQAFQVDFKKSRIVINEEIREALSENTAGTFRMAQETYRTNKQKRISEDSSDLHDSSNRGIKDKVEEIDTAKINDVNEEGIGDIDNDDGNQTNIKIDNVAVIRPGQIYVQPTNEMRNDNLWQPASIETEDGEKHNGVQINTKHPFYEKLYWKFKESGVLIEGLDALLWSLAQAELRIVNPNIQAKMQDFRYSTSRILEQCIEDLPGARDQDLD